MSRPNDEELRRRFDELRDIIDELENGIIIKPPKPQRTPGMAELLHRARIASRRDGFPASSLGGGNSSSGDPVQAIALANIDGEAPDPIRRRADTAIRGIEGALGDLRMARDALGKAFADKPPIGEPACSSCSRIDVYSPVHRAGRCRWCYDWQRLHRADPPIPILRAHDSGRPITTKMVHEAGVRR